MTKPVIKNIIWDVDGVLANLDHAYYRFLTEHENYKDEYKDLKWDDLPNALPIDPKFGSLELTSHPTKGKEFNAPLTSRLIPLKIISSISMV